MSHRETLRLQKGKIERGTGDVDELRLGALWAYFDADQVRIDAASDVLSSYAWGERTITYHRCAHCGCTTHYSTLENEHVEMIAINCRMAELVDIGGIEVRDFDGRETWKYLDEG